METELLEKIDQVIAVGKENAERGRAVKTSLDEFNDKRRRDRIMVAVGFLLILTILAFGVYFARQQNNQADVLGNQVSQLRNVAADTKDIAAGTNKNSEDLKKTLDELRALSITNNESLAILKDCTVIGGECQKRGSEGGAALVAQLIADAERQHAQLAQLIRNLEARHHPPN